MTKIDRRREVAEWREDERPSLSLSPSPSISLALPSVPLVARRRGMAPSLPRPCSSNLLTYPRTPFNRMFLKRIKRDRFVVSPWIGPRKTGGKREREKGNGLSPTDFLRDFQFFAPPFPPASLLGRKRGKKGCVKLGKWCIVFLGEGIL